MFLQVQIWIGRLAAFALLGVGVFELWEKTREYPILDWEEGILLGGILLIASNYLCLLWVLSPGNELAQMKKKRQLLEERSRIKALEDELASSEGAQGRDKAPIAGPREDTGIEPEEARINPEEARVKALEAAEQIKALEELAERARVRAEGRIASHQEEQARKRRIPIAKPMESPEDL